MARLCEDVGHLFGDRVPLSSSVFNRVVGPGLFGSGLDVASTTWLEIYGAIGNLLSPVDAHLLVASSVQFNVVEHAHEDDVAWQILRRRIHPRVRDELLISLPFSHHELCCYLCPRILRWLPPTTLPTTLPMTLS